MASPLWSYFYVRMTLFIELCQLRFVLPGHSYTSDQFASGMAGHAQLKFVMTECSKTQIRLTGLIWV